MGVSIYSIASSVVFFNLALIAAFIMRRSSTLLARQTAPFLLLMVLLGTVRLLTPLDFDKAVIVHSYRVIPAIEDFLNRSVGGSFTIGSLLLLIWLAGAVAFLLADAAKQIRFVRTSRSYPPADRRDLLELAGEFGGDFGLLVSPSISRPYVAGLFRPVIYLPDIELSEAEWRIILRHEVQHIRSHDEGKKLFFVVIQALFWWNPLAHISRAEIDTLIELQCDAKVTAGMDDGEVDRYLELLKSLKSRSGEGSLPVGASPIVWDQPQLAARFEALQNAGSSRKKNLRTVWYILLFSAFLLSYFVIIQPASLPDEEDYYMDTFASEDVIIDSSLSSPEDLYIVFVEGHYYLYSNGVLVNEIYEENLTNEPFASLPIVEG